MRGRGSGKIRRLHQSREAGVIREGHGKVLAMVLVAVNSRDNGWDAGSDVSNAYYFLGGLGTNPSVV